jgi:hypothetical protein
MAAFAGNLLTRAAYDQPWPARRHVACFGGFKPCTPIVIERSSMRLDDTRRQQDEPKTKGCMRVRPSYFVQR